MHTFESLIRDFSSNCLKREANLIFTRYYKIEEINLRHRLCVNDPDYRLTSQQAISGVTGAESATKSRRRRCCVLRRQEPSLHSARRGQRTWTSLLVRRPPATTRQDKEEIRYVASSPWPLPSSSRRGQLRSLSDGSPDAEYPSKLVVARLTVLLLLLLLLWRRRTNIVIKLHRTPRPRRCAHVRSTSITR